MVALGKPLESLTFEFGHSGGAAVLKSHYVGVMTKKDAEKIWTLGPNGTTVPLEEEKPSPFRKAKKPASKRAAKKTANGQKPQKQSPTPPGISPASPP